MVFTFGFAGMKGNGSKLSFDPNLPSHIDKLKFPLTYRGNLIEIEIDQKNIVYRLINGKETVLLHNKKELKLTPAKPAIKKPLKSIKNR